MYFFCHANYFSAFSFSREKFLCHLRPKKNFALSCFSRGNRKSFFVHFYYFVFLFFLLRRRRKKSDDLNHRHCRHVREGKTGNINCVFSYILQQQKTTSLNENKLISSEKFRIPRNKDERRPGANGPVWMRFQPWVCDATTFKFGKFQVQKSFKIPVNLFRVFFPPRPITPLHDESVFSSCKWQLQQQKEHMITD